MPIIPSIGNEICLPTSIEVTTTVLVKTSPIASIAVALDLMI